MFNFNFIASFFGPFLKYTLKETLYCKKMEINVPRKSLSAIPPPNETLLLVINTCTEHAPSTWPVHLNTY